MTLTLPPAIPSETVQIHYFMSGPFGGFGNFVRAEQGGSSYGIVTAVDGKPATDIKIMAYLPGCEIVTLDIPLGRPIPPQALPCRALRKTLLRGHISPARVIQDHHPVEVTVSYVAMWDHQFFGIADGPVTSIQIASALPGKYGQFEIWLPDFTQQTTLGQGQFQAILRDTTTGNIVSALTPSGEIADSLGIKVRASYPWITEFAAKEP